jgi:hypothetical protein
MESPMKRIIVLVIIVLLCGVELWAQTPELKLRPELEKLSGWIGNWDYEGETQDTALGPASKTEGKMAVRPILDGKFMEFSGRRKGENESYGWIEIDGYDALNKNYFMTGLGSDGSVNSSTYTFDDNTLIFSGTYLLGEKQYKIRGTITLAPDFMSGVEKREISFDGQTWIPLFEVKFSKIR